VVRPSIRTNCWLSTISGLALLGCVLSSPIGTLRPSQGPVTSNSLCLPFTSNLDGARGILSSAMPDTAAIDAYRSVFIEVEDETLYSSSHLVSPTYIELDWPSKFLPGSLPRTSPPRTVGVALRC
jgi:hypothetical protein